MQVLHRDGINIYDLNGLLNEGVDTYKKAFHGEIVHYIGSLELPLSKWYGIYTKALPAGKKALREALAARYAQKFARQVSL